MARKTTTTAAKSTKTKKTATTTSRSKVSASTTAKAAASKTATGKTPRRSTAKATTAKASAPAPVVTPAATVLPTPEIVKTLTKRELVDRVVETSGVKKKDAKPVIEALLRELGEALSRGETLNLQPMGKGIVKTRKVLENAEVVELRLRRSKQGMASGADEATKSGATSGAGPHDPLAEAAE